MVSVVVPAAVPEGAAADGVNDDDEGEDDNVNNGSPLPVPLERVHHAGLAQLAPVAEVVLVVAPCAAVQVDRRGACRRLRLGPLRAAGVREVAARGRLAAPGLDRGQAEPRQTRRRVLVLALLLQEAPADVRVGEAPPDPGPGPAALDVAPQPGGVVPEAVLFVPGARHGLPGDLVGDDEGEDGEAEQRDDEGQHGEEVEPQQPGGAAAGAGEAREGDGHERRPQRDGRGGQEVVALGAVGARVWAQSPSP